MPTSLYQIGAISLEVLHAFEKDFSVTPYSSSIFQQMWASIHCSQLIQFFKDNTQTTVTITGPITSMPTEGKGILIVGINGADSHHALSYEKGLILDSNGKGDYETWEDWSNNNPNQKIIRVIPIG